jgi:hypothetical protein
MEKERFRDRLARFMAGRHGMDELYHASVWLGMAILIAGALAKSPIFEFASYLVLILAFARSFSRDGYHRRLENEKYLALTRPLRKWLSLQGRKIRGIKSYRYRKCPGCKALIELPARRGHRGITCPRCRRSFETRITF